jgi:hypothetical protein
MRTPFFVLFALFVCQTTLAQIYEIGGFLGGSNYIGDIGKTDYISPSETAYGFLFRWNKSARHSWRISYTQSKITANDADATAPSRVQRDYSFENDLKELSVGLEFDFFDFDLHDSKPKFTPYVYTGLSYLSYNGLYFVGGVPKYNASQNTAALPMILGVKGRIFDNLVLGLESGARIAFRDDLDGSNPSNNNLSNLRFGNLRSNDWYVFTGFTATYTFGNKPCFCSD